MIRFLAKIPFDPTDAAVARMSADTGIHPNIVRALSGAGSLVACDRCLGKTHLPPWATEADAIGRRDAFALAHRECR